MEIAEGSTAVDMTELSHFLKVSDRRRSTPKSGQNHSESLCAGLRAPCRVFGACSGLAVARLEIEDPRPGPSLRVFGALLAQPG